MESDGWMTFKLDPKTKKLVRIPTKIEKDFETYELDSKTKKLVRTYPANNTSFHSFSDISRKFQEALIKKHEIKDDSKMHFNR